MENGLGPALGITGSKVGGITSAELSSSKRSFAVHQEFEDIWYVDGH